MENLRVDVFSSCKRSDLKKVGDHFRWLGVQLHPPKMAKKLLKSDFEFEDDS